MSHKFPPYLYRYFPTISTFCTTFIPHFSYLNTHMYPASLMNPNQYLPSIDFASIESLPRSEVAQVFYLSYASSVAADALIHPWLNWYVHSEPLEKIRAKQRMESYLSKFYARKHMGYITNPAGLLLAPFNYVSLFAWMYVARRILMQSLDPARVSICKRKLPKEEDAHWTQEFHLETIKNARKLLFKRRPTRWDEAQFYAKQCACYFGAGAALLTGGIFHASTRSLCRVLEFRRQELDHRGRVIYPSFFFALRETNRRRGFYSWFPTCLFVGSTVSLLSFCLPLFLLMNEAAFNREKPREPIARRTARWRKKALSYINTDWEAAFSTFQTVKGMLSAPFLTNWTTATSLSAIGVTASIPFRAAVEAFREGIWLQNLYNKEVRTLKQWVRNERVLIGEMLRVSRKSIRKTGLRRFLIGANPRIVPGFGLMRSSFRLVAAKSVPFGFCWAMYRALDAPLGGTQ